MTARPQEPEFLIQWREWVKAGQPKCCFTCDFYTNDGVCEQHQMRPPDDFAATPDACDQWIDMIPF